MTVAVLQGDLGVCITGLDGSGQADGSLVGDVVDVEVAEDVHGGSGLDGGSGGHVEGSADGDGDVSVLLDGDCACGADGHVSVDLHGSGDVDGLAVPDLQDSAILDDDVAVDVHDGGGSVDDQFRAVLDGQGDSLVDDELSLDLDSGSGHDVFIEESGEKLEFTIVSRIEANDVQTMKYKAESSWTHYGEPGWDIDITTLSADEVGIMIFRIVDGEGLISGNELSVAYSLFSSEVHSYTAGLYLASGNGKKIQTTQTINYPIVDDRKSLLIVGGIFTVYSLASAIAFPATNGGSGSCLYPAVVMLALAAVLPFVNPAPIPGMLWQGMSWAMMGVAGIVFFGLFFTVITFPMVLHLLFAAYAFWKVFKYGKECKWTHVYVQYIAIGALVSAIVSGAVGFLLV